MINIDLLKLDQRKVKNYIGGRSILMIQDNRGFYDAVLYNYNNALFRGTLDQIRNLEQNKLNVIAEMGFRPINAFINTNYLFFSKATAHSLTLNPNKLIENITLEEIIYFNLNEKKQEVEEGLLRFKHAFGYT